MQRGGRGSNRGAGASRGAPAFRGRSDQTRRFNKAPTAADGIDEEFQIQTQRALHSYKTDESIPFVTFPSTLSNTERKYVHFLSNQMGLISPSSGKGDSRQLTVRRKGRNDAPRVVHHEPALDISPQAEAMLLEYFQEWPVTSTELQAMLQPPTESHSEPSAHPKHGRRQDAQGVSEPPTKLAQQTQKWQALLAARQANPLFPGLMQGRQTLPAWSARHEVLSACSSSPVVIVCGETGCGKSTQVPQYLLDDPSLGPHCNMIVTQPRRISAIALAERVAQERCEPVGGVVGYNVRLDSSMSSATQLLFCTTGVLLRRMTGGREGGGHHVDSSAVASVAHALRGVTHVIVDEVHERELNCDFLLALLKEVLASRLCPGLKVILMSATLQLATFQAYFTSVCGPGGPAVVRMSGSAHPVTRYYLEDALLATGYISGGGRPFTVGGIAKAGGGGASSAEQDARLAALVARVRGDVLLPDADGGDGEGRPPAAGQGQGVGTAPAAATMRAAGVQDESSSLQCALCGKKRFASLEDFGVHAATCFGDPCEDDDEEEEKKAEQGAVVAPAQPAPSASRGGVTIALPVGKKGKDLAKQQQQQQQQRVGVDGGDVAEMSPPPSSATPTLPGAGTEEEDAELRALLDEYQAGLMDEDSIDMDLLVYLLGYIVRSAGQGSRSAGGSSTPVPVHGHSTGVHAPSDAGVGAVLVFLPGWEDISGCMEALKAHPLLGNPSKTLVLPLHSQIPVQEQRRVFKRAPPGVTKIILSTNIAETSITIDDVVYVIDAGKVREKSFDPYTGCSALTSVWISQASSRQRAGRAGRVRPGIAYHLFSRARHTAMVPFAVPEILRMPLEELVLQVLMLGHADVSAFLSSVVEPPSPPAIRTAVQVLLDIGAVRPRQDCPPTAPGSVPSILTLTPLGLRLASLPLPPRLGVALLWSVAFRCVDPILTLVSAAGSRPPWVLPMVPSERHRADRARLSFAKAGRSDHAAVLGAYQGYQQVRAGRGGAGGEYGWCRDQYVSSPTLNMISSVRAQLAGELVRSGILSLRRGGVEGAAAGGGVTWSTGTGPLAGWIVPAAGLDRDIYSVLQSFSSRASVSVLFSSMLAAGLYPNICRANPPSAVQQQQGQGKGRGAGREQEDAAGPKLTRMETRTSKRAQLHMSSVNSVATASLGPGGASGAPGQGSGRDSKAGAPPPGALALQPVDKTEWLVYEEQSIVLGPRKDAVSLRNTAVVHPLALVLLCGAAAVGGALWSGVGTGTPLHELQLYKALAAFAATLPAADMEIDMDMILQSVSSAFTAKAGGPRPPAAGAMDGDEEDEDEEEDQEGEGNFKAVLLPVDSWVRFQCNPRTGALLSLLRCRLGSAFLHSVVYREQQGQGQGRPPSEQQIQATMDAAAKLLVSECEGPVALRNLSASWSGPPMMTNSAGSAGAGGPSGTGSSTQAPSQATGGSARGAIAGSRSTPETTPAPSTAHGRQQPPGPRPMQVRMAATSRPATAHEPIPAPVQGAGATTKSVQAPGMSHSVAALFGLAPAESAGSGGGMADADALEQGLLQQPHLYPQRQERGRGRGRGRGRRRGTGGAVNS